MHIKLCPKKFLWLFLPALLACNVLTPTQPAATNTVNKPPTAAATATLAATVVPTKAPALAPAYVPPECAQKPLATISPVSAVTPTSIYPTNVPIDGQKQIRVFEAIVQKIEEVYLYTDYNGKDWNALKAKYRAKIVAGLTADKFYEEMKALIDELGDDHSQFLSPQDVARDSAQFAGTDMYVGIGVMTNPLETKKKVTILLTFPNAAAERGGLQAHESIIAVDGTPVMADGQTYIQRLRGPECSAVQVTVQSPNGQTRQVLLVRYKVNSSMPINAQLLKTTDGSKIGYFLLPTFLEETIPQKVRDALQSWGPLDGLVIDDRINEGGSEEILRQVLSYFTGGVMGNYEGRKSARRLVIRAQAIHNSQSVPLVVLIGKDSVSYGEVFPGVLQDTGRAKLIGSATAGNVETLYTYDFEDGSQMWLAQERFRPINSKALWEGVGVQPDIKIAAEWDTYTFDDDPILAAALKALGRK